DKSVDRFMGIWRAKQDEFTDEPSTNWLQFRTYIAQQEQIMQETLHKAALSTWTGGVSASLGFNCVESVTIDYDHPWYGEVVTAVFKKHS
ncbi:MAG: hypothetical protein NUV52_04245, partial [Candidatus Roizmanbacteria bacterium]|nr:hypothetical protein [Candidatus Roizmanbacteria bacterium]